MKSERNNKKLQMYVSERLIDDIEAIMKKRDMSRSQAVRMILELGLDVHHDLSRLGLVKMVDMVHACRQVIRGIDDPSKFSIEITDEDGNIVEKDGVYT